MANTDRHRKFACAAVVAVVAFAIFAPALRHQFLDWDDQYFLTANATYNPPTFSGVMRYWITPLRSLYEPVPFTIWGAVAGWVEMDARFFHGLNVIAHAGTSVLVFALLRRLVSSNLAAMCGALLFAIHPIQAEAVNWASSFHTVLSGTFVVLALWLFLRNWFIAATAAFVLALLSKPSAVVAPLLAAILAHPLDARSKRLLIGWLVLSAPIIVVAHFVQPARYVFDVPLYFRPVVALDTLTFDLGKIVWPTNLAIDYGRSPRWLIASTQARWTWAVPIALATACVIMRKTFACSPRSFALFVAALLPALGFAKFEFQHYSTAADRYVYLAMLGPAMLLACLVKRWPRIVVPFVAVALPLFGYITVRQSHYWADTPSLMNRTLAVNPHSRVAHRTLGYLASREGRTDEAIERYQRVLAQDPNDVITNFNLGNVLLARSEFAEAVNHYEIAARLDPDDAAIHQNYGMALTRLGRAAEAHEQFTQAVRLAPASADAHANLGSFYLSVDEPALAEREFAEALRLSPIHPIALRGMAKLRSNR